MWPGTGGGNSPPALSEVVERLRGALRGQLPDLLAGCLDACDPTERWALLKRITGGLRVGMSARRATMALAERFGVTLAEVEEVSPGARPPYDALSGRAPNTPTHAQ